MAIQREYRLKNRSSFSYIYKHGDYKVLKLLTLYVVPANNLKIGIAVGKKVGNSVIRSLVKRRIGERMRLLIPSLDSKKNYVIIARPEAKDATSAQFEKELKYALNALKCFKE
ncbi:MAG: ribonuclease P protein component [Clostridia bacterium]|nr:ribonuclease P protein component [Clostridia bacterium]